MRKFFLIFLFGGSGALSRYWLSGLVYRLLGENFPYGTYLVNVFGCFLFGMIFELAEQRMFISPEMRIVILTGFMGAFTTFSSFIFESAQLARGGQFFLCLVNVFGQVGVGFGCLYLGYVLVRVF